MDNLQIRESCPEAQGTRSLAMVYGVDQRLRQIWESAQAIRNGTLYPELYKPMTETTMPIDGARPSRRQAVSFSAWELRLYLDTHPNDQQALRLYKRYCGALETPGYACAFTPQGQSAGETGSAACRETWRWLDDPWPWELAANEQTEDDCNVCV